MGSGAGGATIAREISAVGKKVILIEKGREHQWVGSVFAVPWIFDKFGLFSRSREGVLIDRAITAGGSTLVFAGNAFDPPTWLANDYGIDLSIEVSQTREELKLKPLPDDFFGPGVRRLREAAGELGINLKPQPKFIDPKICDPHCDDCMLGCRRKAKWTAREYIAEARNNGARFLLSTEVREVIIEGPAKTAVGIKAVGPQGPIVINADKVILAAGGIGTPIILQRSGIWEAGRQFFMDPMNVVMGVTRDVGSAGEMTFSHASEDFIESDGILLGNVGAKSAFIANLVRLRTLKNLLKIFHYKRTIGMFVKIGDSMDGWINFDGTISRPLSREDQFKLSKGTALCEKVLIKAGADPNSIGIAIEMGGHPGGTAAIGKVVNEGLETEVKNLFVCDAGIFPRSTGVPPALTIIALAKWLAKRLLS